MTKMIRQHRKPGSADLINQIVKLASLPKSVKSQSYLTRPQLVNLVLYLENVNRQLTELKKLAIQDSGILNSDGMIA